MVVNISKKAQQAQENLTTRQHAFIAAYTGDCLYNGANAAKAAGYSGSQNALSVIAYENLRKPKIWFAIRERISALYQAADLSVQRVLVDIEMVRQLAIQDRNWMAALRGSEMQGKFLSMFSDRIEHVHSLESIPLDELVQLANKLARKVDGLTLIGESGSDGDEFGVADRLPGDRTTH